MIKTKMIFLLKLLLIPKGRVDRIKFAKSILATTLLGVVISFILLIITQTEIHLLLEMIAKNEYYSFKQLVRDNIIFIILYLLLLYVFIILIIKRLHDLNLHGSLAFIPFTLLAVLYFGYDYVNDRVSDHIFLAIKFFIFMCMGVLLFKRGSIGNNRFGDEV